MGIFDGPDFEAFMGGLDGKIVNGDCIGVYDADHKRKLAEDEYYGPDKNVRIINVDHFAIKGKLKDKLEEYRQKIYAVIDDLYAHKDEINVEEELDQYGYEDCEEF